MLRVRPLLQTTSARPLEGKQGSTAGAQQYFSALELYQENTRTWGGPPVRRTPPCAIVRLSHGGGPGAYDVGSPLLTS